MAFGSLLFQTAVVTKTIAKVFGWPSVGNEANIHGYDKMGIHEPSFLKFLVGAPSRINNLKLNRFWIFPDAPWDWNMDPYMNGSNLWFLCR